ncbi:MAG: ATP-dependent Zn protease [Microcoleaceae cyanobacterium]
MRPVTLNLIAITIFLMTLSVLMGPLINLSPTIPASIVFVLLVLGAADALALQGQGSSILLDALEGSSGQTRDRVIHHEAGHFLAAYLMEIPVSGYALNAWEAFQQGQKAQGGVRFNDEELLTQLQQGQLSTQLLDRYCTVWMAGIAAEQWVYQQANGGTDDRQKIRILWRQLQRSSNEAQIKERWAILQAKALLEKHQSAYDALVTALKQRTPIPECYQILEQQMNDE